MRLLVILVLGFSFSGFTQTFGEIGTVWKNYVAYSYPNGSPGAGYASDYYTSRYEYFADTVIGSDTFQLVSKCGLVQRINSYNESYDYSDTIYVNQDAGKVFMGDSPFDLQLMYDFNLMVGDSFEVVVGIPYPNDTSYFEVIQVDSLIINGSYRKTMQFEDIDSVHEPGMFWVEGVGDTVHGVFQSTINKYANYANNCFIENNITHLGDCEPDFICPEYIPYQPGEGGYSVNIVPVESPDQVLVYPNPFFDQLAIVYDSTDVVYTTYLFDAEGRQVHFKQSSGNHALLELGHLSSGVYFLEVYGINRKIKTKVIKL